MQSNQRRFACKSADYEGDMLLTVVRGSESDDLRRRHVFKWKLCTSDDLDTRLLSFVHDIADRDGELGSVWTEQPQSRQQPGGARQVKRGTAGLDAVRGDWVQRPHRRSVEVLAGIGDCKRGLGIQPVFMPDHHRRS